MKDQLKNAKDERDKIKSDFEIYKKESVEENNELHVEKIKLHFIKINSDRTIQELTDQLQE